MKKTAKFKVDDKVILLDFRAESHLSEREYDHFWVAPMDKYIGEIFTIKEVHQEYGFDDKFWYQMNVDKKHPNWGFNEHWLQLLKPLEDELFEI